MPVSTTVPLLFLSIVGVIGDCPNGFQVTCYWGSWSIYRPDYGRFTTDNLDPKLCTTIVYAFAGLDLDLEITSLDPKADITEGGYSKVIALKEENPCLKVILAVGGSNEKSRKYSVMAHTVEGRTAFANSVLKFLAYYGFDGVDLDWEYPTLRGGIKDDYNNFPLVLQTLKQTLEPWGYVVSIAVSMSESIIRDTYDIQDIARSVDYVYLMAYDHVSASSPKTDLSAPMSEFTKAVNLWLENGLPADKLFLGIPFYGRSFILEDPTKNGIGAPVTGPGDPGAFSGEHGFLAYYEILGELMVGEYETKEEDGTIYSYNEDLWITYDNEASVKNKTHWAIAKGLKGVMIWSMENDDFGGQFGNRYPLLNAMNSAIKESKLYRKRNTN
ncbi:unnamed protein product [Acanthoscelides obtectus]|uniref:GH18 domain-containing protein n=1 Tax=Acanthoscelides obtectus TaxID=200917 RepID=A0A9P0JK58_ACAOB|nr:unnamed protein product [Acanthoscelides obtectus]CAK1665753.1 Acidic mammalian chitinase [Acanthoscelides obtectus]